MSEETRVLEIHTLNYNLFLKEKLIAIGWNKIGDLSKQSNGITNGEYRVAMRGESWKMELSNTIDTVMKRAKSKKQFRFYMKQMGYDVKWEDSRKYITYTCPNGRKCRDNKLHESKYRKENMEYEFEIRRNERNLQAEYGGCTGHTYYCLRPGTQLAGVDITTGIADGLSNRNEGESRRDYDIRTDETAPTESESDIRSGVGECREDTGADVAERDGRGVEPATVSEGLIITGWEAERADLITAEMLRRAEQEARIQAAPTGSTDRAPALRKNLCKFKNCDKNDMWERLENSRSDFLQYTMDTVICQGTLDISLLEWSAAEWNQADIRRLSRACRGT